MGDLERDTAIGIIGVDPGPLTGVIVLDVLGTDEGGRARWSAEIAQVSPGLVVPFLRAAIQAKPRLATWIGLEQFRDGEYGRGQASRVTREVIGAIEAARLTDHATRLHRFAAASHKPWNGGGDKLRGGLQLHADLAKMRHARSAGQVALYTAVLNAGLPDPVGRVGKVFWR